MSTPSILVTGSGGQIGTVLVKALREKHGSSAVLATDLGLAPDETQSGGPYEQLDVTDRDTLRSLLRDYKITEVYHLAALLSSKGEQNINLTWNINFDAHRHLLEMAREHKVQKLFFPSTIGIYGPTTPRRDTPQHASFQPGTIYGISKVTGELWNQYYRTRYGMDIRSLRYPGVISYEVIPEGGTTDFAVEMFFELKRKGHYECYLKEDTILPMIYMPDVLKATLGLMSSDAADLSTSMGYNLSGFSLSPASLFAELKKHHPGATISYNPDSRQRIADSWSQTIDDSAARSDWGWEPDYDMSSMVQDMVKMIG